jgi:hypothetical protein
MKKSFLFRFSSDGTCLTSFGKLLTCMDYPTAGKSTKMTLRLCTYFTELVLGLPLKHNTKYMITISSSRFQGSRHIQLKDNFYQYGKIRFTLTYSQNLALTQHGFNPHNFFAKIEKVP